MYTKDQIQLILKEYRNNFDIKHSIFISNIKDHPQYNLLYKIYRFNFKVSKVFSLILIKIQTYFFLHK